MTTRFKTSIQFKGPFFDRDPAKTFRANGRKMIAAAVAEGERDVIAQMQRGQGDRERIRLLGDRVSDHVIGRVKSLGGKPWAVTGVVSVNNSGFSPAEGVSLMAAASRVEAQTHAFRRTASRLRRARSANLDELLRGIA
jgi:hypothetical protein